MRIQRLIAIWAAKLCSTACRLAGKQGVTLAGKLARKIDPDILRELSLEVREKIFVVCGTNGKTTTNNLLCSAIESEGMKLVCNHTGSNMLDGVTAAFVLAAKNNGHLDADYASIEIDEASTVRVFPYFKPDYMVLTNLFRDQLDRYGEIDITMNLLKKAMQMAPDMTVIVNGDDALSAYLAMESGNPYVTYGITEQVFKEQDTGEIREGRFCKRCGERLEYDFYHYSQLGMYHCPKCGFARPEVDFDALKAINDDVVGWLELEAIPSISYPITQGEDNEYYLHRTIKQTYNFAGSIFIDSTNASDFSDCNTIIYGHNMKNGSMFGKLKQMYESGKYKDSKYLWICTPDGKYRYEIFSMQYANVNSDVYTLFSEHDDQFGAYVNKMAKQSKVNMKTKGLSKDDYVVTLSTCTSNESMRFVVQARWVGTYK